MKFHAHAITRMLERGASEEDVTATVREGERFGAKFGRQGFRRNFSFEGLWRGRRYHIKQVEVNAIWENDDWLVISVIVKYF
jgi:Domain of unknown function (DUF4258)